MNTNYTMHQCKNNTDWERKLLIIIFIIYVFVLFADDIVLCSTGREEGWERVWKTGAEDQHKENYIQQVQ